MRDEYLKWICGFANAQGGVLEIGKDNRGNAVGLPDADKLLEDLPNKIRDILGIVPAVDRAARVFATVAKFGRYDGPSGPSHFSWAVARPILSQSRSERRQHGSQASGRK